MNAIQILNPKEIKYAAILLEGYRSVRIIVAIKTIDDEYTRTQIKENEIKDILEFFEDKKIKFHPYTCIGWGDETLKYKL